MQNIVTLIKDENIKNKRIVKNLDSKKKYKLQIKLDDNKVIYYPQELSPKRIYDELEVLEFVGILSPTPFPRSLPWQ